MLRSMRIAIVGRTGDRNQKKYLTCLIFVIVFFVVSNVQADIVLMGVMKPPCAEATRYKTPSKSAANCKIPTPKESKETVYLSLAQAIAKASESRPLPSGSAPSRVAYPMSTSTVARPFK